MAINTTIVTDKAKSVISEGLKNNISIPAGAITPATLMAMTGLAQGGALQIPQEVTAIKDAMAAKAAELAATAPALAAQLTSTLSALSTLQAKMMPSANPAAFGQIVMQAQAHIGDATEIKRAMNYMSSINFDDLGSGISNMASVATQGLEKVMGDLPKAAEALETAGKLVDMSNPSALGSGAGLVEKLKSVKLSNASGVNQALIKAGVDLENLNDPTYSENIDKALGTITDPGVINTISKQMGVPVTGGIQSLKDLTDINKLLPSSVTKGLTTDLKGMATKLADMGASFSSPAAAANMLKNIEIPAVPSLNSAASSLSSMVDSTKSTIAGLTGTGSGAFGLPSMQDFTQAISGGPKLDEMMSALTSGAEEAIASATAGVQDMISSTTSLMSKAGIDLESTPTVPNLGGVMSFGTGLHKLGTDSGVTDILGKMATPDAFGDSIKLSLIEGKNKAVMAANGIKPLDFSGTQPANPFAGLPSYAGSDSSLNLGGQTAILGQSNS